MLTYKKLKYQKNPSKRLDTTKTMKNLKNTFYEDIEIQDIMKKILSNKKEISIFSKNIIHTELKNSTYTNIFTSYPMMYHTLM